MSRVIIYGFGNVGNHLAHRAKSVGYDVYVISDSNLVAGFKCIKIHDLETFSESKDLLFLTVPDQFIDSTFAQIPASFNGAVISCSGAIAMIDSKNAGVWYPLYSFSRNIEIDWSQVPVFIESRTDEIEQSLRDFSIALMVKSTVQLRSEERKQLHLAAVFVNNFVNACLIGAETVLNSTELSFNYLLPILEQTIQKVQHNSPLLTQTGPAKRNDEITLKAHLDLLKTNGEESQLYAAISKYIQQKFK